MSRSVSIFCQPPRRAHVHQDPLTTQRREHLESQVSIRTTIGKSSCKAFHRFPVFGAHGLAKRDLLSLPDPFAIISVDGEMVQSTNVIRKNLNPTWNEHFDMCVVPIRYFLC